MPSSLRLALPVLALALAAQPTAQSTQHPDRILLHGHIYTAAKGRPQVEALAIRGDRIVATGSDADIMKLAGPSTVTTDLKGQTVVPGLNDAHGHFVGLGASLQNLDLRGVTSADEMAARVTPAAAMALALATSACPSTRVRTTGLSGAA